MIKKRITIAFCFATFSIAAFYPCTSAIIGADMNPYGRPLLWKNRDTSNADNKIEYVPSKGEEFGYVALYNSQDSLLKEAWMGMNDFGFAVMNTASYNLKNDTIPQKDMDKEGLIMSIALKKCKTVDDFAVLLDTITKPMGVEANFGVIDALGNGAYFETDNYTYTRFNLSDAPDHVLVRTNYSKSGRDNEGFGFVREQNALHLLQPYIEDKNISSEVLTENLSRSFYHSLLKEDYSENGQEWVIDQDFIPRYTSTATIVIEGCRPVDSIDKITPDFVEKEYIMWTGLGYPPCSEIMPVYCKEDGVPEVLRGTLSNGNSEQGEIMAARKSEVFPVTKGNGNKYIYMPSLINERGDGYIQTLVPKNLKTYQETRSAHNR